MIKSIVIILLLIASLYFPALIFAEVIVFKSGQSVEGKLVEKTDKYIKIDFQGVPLTYFFDEIESIDGQKIKPSAKEQLQIEQKTPESKNADTTAEVNVYLNTKEVIKGKLIKKTNDEIVIEKQGNTLTFRLSEVSKIEEGSIIKPVLKSRKFPFSTAIITYKYSGVQVGSGEVDIDAVGNRINKSDSFSVTFAGQTALQEKREMYDGKLYYSFIPKEKMVVKEEVKGDVLSKIFDEAALVDYYVGERKFLDKDCKVYEMPAGTFLFWNGIELKEEVKNSLIGSYVKEAVDIRQDIVIPEDKFKVPAGLRVLTSEAAMKEVQNMFKDLGEKLKNTKCKI